MKELYLEDSYKKEWDTTVKSVNGEESKFIVLEESAFYPKGGGQPHDEGKIITEDGEYNVVFVGKFNDEISHEVDKAGLKEGQKVHCKLDWDRRYKLMRYHTAAHVLSQVIYNETKARITGNQLELDKGRIDFNLENFDKELVNSYAQKTNEIIEKELPVKKFFMKKEDVYNNPDLFSLKNALPPDVEEMRIVQIGENPPFDVKACGGTHVDNVKEIGKISIVNTKNKGKNNRRIYFTIV